MKNWKLTVLLLVVLSIFVSCAKKEEPKMEKEPTAAADDMYADVRGKIVTMSGSFVDNDAIKFEQSIKAFEDETGIDIQYEGTKEFEASIAIRIEGGNPPDIVDFPQPGLLSTFAKKGYVIDLNKTLDMEKVKSNYIQSWLDMATMETPDGPIMAGLWSRVNGKSLVWYNKKEFDAAGYKVPTTWDELVELQDMIIADGDTPWAIGIESGAATGWAATDWVEEFMLRTTSLENYDKWVAGELKFNSPEVRGAVEALAEIWFADGMVYGGRKGIATIGFGDAPKVMFEAPPKAWLHKQGNFITTFFPDNLVAAEDYDFFYLPGKDPAYGKPVLVAGDIYAMFDDRPEVRMAMQFFATGASVEGWVRAGGMISPHKDSSLDWYSNVVDRKVAEVIQNATSVRFDGSDLMPGSVGAGSFWTNMTGYVAGAMTLDEALDAIDASWPE